MAYCWALLSVFFRLFRCMGPYSPYTLSGVWSKREQVRTATNQNGYRSRVYV